MITIISLEEAQKEFHELEEKLKCLEKNLPAISMSFFPLPAMIECANEGERIIARMKELKREYPEIDGKVPALGTIRMMLALEADVQAERLERLRDNARREGNLTPEYEKNLNGAIKRMKSIRKKGGIFLRITLTLARWWIKIRHYDSDRGDRIFRVCQVNCV